MGAERTVGADLTRFWSVRLPQLVDPWAPSVADAIADGSWTAPWGRIVAFAPLVALAVGVLTPFFWPGMTHVYSQSLLFMALVVVGAIVSGPLGVMVLLGYSLGILIAGSEAKYHFGDYPFRRGGSLLMSYMLLALPAVVMPGLARQLVDEIAPSFRGQSRPLIGIRAFLFAATCGVLIFLWCQAMIVLIRPVFTWVWDVPRRTAIFPVQFQWPWLVGAALLAALARIALEERVNRRIRDAEVVSTLHEERSNTFRRRGEFWGRIPLPGRLLLASAAGTLFLAGTYTEWIDALLMGGAIAALGFWRSRFMIGLSGPWRKLMQRAPRAIRFMGATVLGYVVAYLLAKGLWSTGTLRPVFLGTLFTLLLFCVFFPQQRAPPSAAQNG
jgi:hypothetical protein